MKKKDNNDVDFSRALDAYIDKHAAGKNEPLLKEFAHRVWEHGPVEELAERKLSDVFGATKTLYEVVAQSIAPGAVEPFGLHIRNVNLQRDGWENPYTLVMLVHEDMPFITDSVLLQLSHHGLTSHFMRSTVVHFQQENGHIAGLEGGPAQTLIYAEIDRIEAQEFPALHQRIGDALAEVHQVVSDFSPMKNRVERLVKDVQQSSVWSDQQKLDAAEFLHWLLQDNFTFLGFREFSYADGVVSQVPDTALGILRLRRPATSRKLVDLRERTRNFILEPELLTFSKSGTRSRVHRFAYPDYIAIKHVNTKGEVIGESGFLGLFTSRVYTEHPENIPIINQKVQRLLARSNLRMDGFDGKVLSHVLATHPRDELFQASEDELFGTVMSMTYNHEHSRIKLYMREDNYGLFVYCLVYTPRELYSTSLRVRIQEMLSEALGAEDAEFYAFFSESILVRTQFILRVDPAKIRDYQLEKLEKRIVALTRDWSQDFVSTLDEVFGAQRARAYVQRYGKAFSTSYKESFSVRTAAYDVEHLEALSKKRDLAMRFYRHSGDEDTRVNLKIYRLGLHLPLSDIMPMLENLGLRVIGENSYSLSCPGNINYSIQDFYMTSDQALDLNLIGDVFEDAFINIWYGEAENDSYNRLVLMTGRAWREVAMLRAYARYAKQIRVGFSQQFIADTLVKHLHITDLLIQCFHARFGTGESVDPADEKEFEQRLQNVRDELENVQLLNEDRILRQYMSLIENTVRTNYYRTNDEGKPLGYLSFKLDTTALSDLPEPRPAHEIFVYSPWMEGVHLRNGEFARGGLRWSDRQEDYRTEVLGLVKAQSVKNAVIVPTGAKGCFVVKRETSSREDFIAEGIKCYRIFVQGLLDITDNLVAAKIVPPEDVVRYDGDDSYLVVAADKGTATFSDTANEIAESYGFWLGDAFASGGSNGYDHKAMGITAKGAWISVQRHFLEAGIDVQTEPVSVLGIGDMSGDVFGNGMLLSSALKVVAAFNHMHIFIDPDPDTALSFEERKRLYALPRSSWTDYKAELVSQGGGIFSRLDKAIPISKEMQKCFDISETNLSPDELINKLLKAPVGLIWNGGIGTYVKSSTETDLEVGDRTNDSVRVNASELRCSVFGEGGNLGMTQKARIEFALNDGAVNTDFIDNSAGVDCSDHEVNIKILLNGQVADGKLDLTQRNALLVEMTDEVSDLVLHNNYRQGQALSLANKHSESRYTEYLRLIHMLEHEQNLSRELEDIPTDEVLLERKLEGKGLTRPELAVLLCYAKLHIKTQLLASNMDQYESMSRAVLLEFPPSIRERYRESIFSHPLKREIVATQIANDLVHHMGISFVSHMKEFVGGSSMDVVRAYDISVSVFRIRESWNALEALSGVSEHLRLELLSQLVVLGRRATRWFLRHHRSDFDLDTLVSHCRPILDKLAKHQLIVRGAVNHSKWQKKIAQAIEAGVPEHLAEVCVDAAAAASGLPIIDAAQNAGVDVELAAEVYARLGRTLGFNTFGSQVVECKTSNHWQSMEKSSLLDDLSAYLSFLSTQVLQGMGSNDSVEVAIQKWTHANTGFVNACAHVMDQARHAPEQVFALYTMTSRKLRDLRVLVE